MVGNVNDPLEHEADRVADRVMRSAEAEISTGTATPRIRRACTACKEENEQSLQPKRIAGPPSAAEAPAVVHEVLHTSGAPLDASTRAFFEPRFGFDFGHVRVHTDERAVRSARTLGAAAYTVGPQIVFGAGAFAPTGRAGRTLLAHELAHVVQQGAARVGSTRLQRQPETTESTGAAAAAEAKLRALAARPSRALAQWKRLTAAEHSFIVLAMAGRYGPDFVQEFLTYADGRKKPDPSVEVTNRETPSALTARGFRFAGDPAGVPLWVHPSGREVQLLRRDQPAAPIEEPPERPPEVVERCTKTCEDVDDTDECKACCDERIPGSSDEDFHCRNNCKSYCEQKM